MFEIRVDQDEARRGFSAWEAGNEIGRGYLDLARPEENVRDLAVLPQHQRRGIALAIMKRMISEAKVKGLNRLTVVTGLENLPAQNLYAQLGFTRLCIVPHPEIGQGYKYEMKLEQS